MGVVTNPPACMNMDWINSSDAWMSLLTLTVLEIVLGIDNVIFIAILAGKLPPEQQARARRVGLMLALVTRILLLSLVAAMARLTAPLFEVAGHPFSGRDLILLAGGLFLLFKATREIHEKLEGEDGGKSRSIPPTFSAVIAQILILDVVFSLDSVITAVGMARHLMVMIIAVILAVGFMLVFASRIAGFIDKHPTLKILALSFLLMIGGTLVMESFGKEVHKGYIYFAMAFSAGVEMLNIRVRRKAPTKVELHQPYR
jgi:predicted tellurium resistance membrane protein TerC